MSSGETAALDERSARVVLAAVGLPGDLVTARLVRTVGAVETVRLGLREADTSGVMGSEMDHWRERVRSGLQAQHVEELLDATAEVRAQLLIPGDEAWPDSMDVLGDHGPLALWVRGDVTAVSAPSIGILGTRAATGYGAETAAELASDATAQELTVVSTGGYGVAATAHRAALLSGGRTVAVLPGGVDRLYPGGQTELLEQVMRAGAVVSELPPGSPPTRWRMMQQGRLIAALASVVVVVEAGKNSEALLYAAQASEFGRPVGAVPGPSRRRPPQAVTVCCATKSHAS